MGDHAEDEIHKEIHGHYPWEDPFENSGFEEDDSPSDYGYDGDGQ